MKRKKGYYSFLQKTGGKKKQQHIGNLLLGYYSIKCLLKYMLPSNNSSLSISLHTDLGDRVEAYSANI
ncbi:hypothetical protein K1719_027287 [Acacia pycnantha]|nr:hypothetical protein K1719_027287 [Acacia pycnantha]